MSSGISQSHRRLHCAAPFRRELSVPAIELGDLRCNGDGRPAIVEDVVRVSQPGEAIELGRHDGVNLHRRNPAAGDDAANLLVLGAIDHQNPVQLFGEAATLEQQGNDRHAVRAAPCGHLSQHLASDQRVEGRLETHSRRRIGKGPTAELRPIQLAGWQQHAGIERGGNRGVSGLSLHRKPMRDDIGIGDLDAERAEGLCNFRLAAADAARHADDVGHRLAGKIKRGQGLAEKERNATGNREIGAERQWNLVVASFERDQADADRGTDDRR
jgi:hypothetical protein